MTEPVEQDARELARRLLAEQPERLPGQRVAFIYVRCSSDSRGRGKSVERQVEDCWDTCRRNGWFVAAVFIDNDRSASYAARKDREEYERMVAAMRTAEVHVLVCWEASRATRDVRAYLDLADLSRELDVNWCFNGTVYNLDDPDDEFRTMLGAVLDHREVRVMARRVKDGIAKAARDGKPHGGPAPYGYYRVYDQRTREFVAQEVDDAKRDVPSPDGGTETFSPAEVVREVFAHIAGGGSCHKMMQVLNARGVPAPNGGKWDARRVQGIAKNASYAGWRVYQGEPFRRGLWAPLVDEQTWQSARRRMEDPKRKKSRPNKARNLLSYIATCGECDSPLSPQWRKARKAGHTPYMMYRCKDGRCVSIRAEKLDAYVESVIIGRLSDPATLDWLVRPDDTEAQRAAERAAQKRAELDEWKAEAKAGRVKPSDFAEITEGIRAQIADLEAAATPEYVPVALRGLIGEEAAQAWDALELPAKRDVIRSIATVELWTIGCGRRTFDPSRVRIAWQLDAKAAGGGARG